MVVRTPTFDFDQHSVHYRDHWADLAREMHEMDFPMAWTEHHGGFWVLASWEDGKRVLEDWEHFSSDNDIEKKREGFRGVAIPQQPFPAALSESDPPISLARRRLELPFFTPKGLQTWGPVAVRFFREALDACRGRHEVDLVNDIVIPTTARTTLNIVGFEADNWRDAAMSAHRSAWVKRGSPDYPDDEMARTRDMFLTYLAARRVEPRNDIISALANGKIDGVPLTDADAQSMLAALVFGGFDTTTSAVTNILIWLAKRPEAQTCLMSGQGAMSRGIDEFLRVFPPVIGMARNARQDIEIGPRKVRKGDRILCWYPGTNRDPRRFPDPATLDLGRANAHEHLSFSSGTHRCLGAGLARLEITAMVDTFLRDMPDYSIDEDRAVPYPLFGKILGYSFVPVKFNITAAA